MPDITPASPAAVVAAIAALVDARKGRVRLALDGAAAAQPDEWGDLVVTALAPRQAAVVRADRFWRPASLRLESGRRDPDAWLERWLDAGALGREALEPFPATGRALPGLRDPATDRSLRGSPVELSENGVLVVTGRTLLGRGLPFDVVVHFWLSSAALARRTPADEQWTLVALDRYEREVHPAVLADLVVRVDDPKHPALARPDRRGSQT